AERYLTLAALHLPSQRVRVAHSISVEDFRNPVFAELFDVISSVDGPLDPEAIAEQLGEQATVELERLLEAADELQAPNRLVDDSINQLRLRALREQSEEVQRMLQEETEQGRKDVLIAEKTRIRDEMNALRGRPAGQTPTRAV